MTSISLQVDIPVERARVYDALIDPARFGAWQPMHESWPEGLPEIAQGGSFVQRTRFMGRSNDITWTVIELRSPTTLVLDGLGPMGMAMRTSYRLSGDRAITTVQVDSRLDGAPAAIGAMVRRRGRALALESVDNLTALLIGAETTSRPSDEGGLDLASVVGVLARGASALVPSPVRRVAEALARRP